MSLTLEEMAPKQFIINVLININYFMKERLCGWDNYSETSSNIDSVGPSLLTNLSFF